MEEWCVKWLKAELLLLSCKKRPRQDRPTDGIGVDNQLHSITVDTTANNLNTQLSPLVGSPGSHKLRIKAVPIPSQSHVRWPVTSVMWNWQPNSAAESCSGVEQDATRDSLVDLDRLECECGKPLAVACSSQHARGDKPVQNWSITAQLSRNNGRTICTDFRRSYCYTVWSAIGIIRTLIIID